MWFYVFSNATLILEKVHPHYILEPNIIYTITTEKNVTYLQKRRFTTAIGAKKHPQLSRRNPNGTVFKNWSVLTQMGGDGVVEVLPFNGIILSGNAATNRERNGPEKSRKPRITKIESNLFEEMSSWSPRENEELREPDGVGLKIGNTKNGGEDEGGGVHGMWAFRFSKNRPSRVSFDILQFQPFQLFQLEYATSMSELQEAKLNHNNTPLSLS